MGIARAKLGLQADGGGKADAGSRGTDQAAQRKGIAGLGVFPGAGPRQGSGIPRDRARAPQSSHRWNRFLNRIDPPLHRGGRELRLFCTGGRARRPHGLELLPRPPACQAGATQLGKAGVGHAGGRSAQGPGQSRRLGAGGRPLKRPGRLPPPASSAPGCLRPAPKPGSAPARCSGCVRPQPPARHRAQWPISVRSGARLRCHSFPLKLGRWGGTSEPRGVVSRKGRGAGRAVLCIKALSVRAAPERKKQRCVGDGPRS